MKEKIKLVGNWFKETFKSKKKRDLENIYELIHEEFNYDRMNLEKEKITTENAKTYVQELLRENSTLTNQNDKLYKYLEKVALIVQDIVTDNKELSSEIKKLQNTIDDLKSTRYKVVNIRPAKTPKAEVMKIKSGIKTSKIIKKIKEGK